MKNEVRYCTTEDGVRIAYCVEGEGPPLLLSHNPYAFSLSHLVPALDKAIHRIGRGRKLIRFDLRGTGLSQAVEDVSPTVLVRDVEAIVAALNLERFILFGVAFGGPRAIEYAARHPDFVEGLVLYDTFPRFTDAFPLQVSQALPLLCRGNWKLATRTFADAGVRRQDELEGLRWAEMIEQSLTGEMMARLIESHTPLDVTGLLPRIECPTLVCHSRNDGMYPFTFGQKMAEIIPNARLVPLVGDPAGPFSNTDLAVRALETAMQAVDAIFPPLTTVPGAGAVNQRS